MSDITLFIVGMIAIVVVWGGISLRNVNIIDYFKTRDGLGILKGIVLAVCFAMVLGVSSKVLADEDGWFKKGEVYAGMDYTQRTSPMCTRGGIDDRTTSNLGVEVEVYRKGNFSIGTRYTHHSCAFGPDDDGYDGVGIQVRFRLW